MRTPTEIREAFHPSEAIVADRPFYLVGIGGAGMSALAGMLKKRGIEVTGSDSTESPATVSLREAGIPVRIGHSGADIRADHQVVLSDAIDLETSPEVAAARTSGCSLFRRSQLLSWLLKGKKVIAVTGTHGKTTVTGMIGAGLRAAGMNPTIVVGAYVPEFGGAVVEGSGEYAVVEACEAYNAFLDIEPHIVVLTNLEPDHLDFHRSYEALERSVRVFLDKVPDDGKVLYHEADAGAANLAKDLAHKLGYGTLDEELSLPGRHNLANAAGALRAAVLAGADAALALEGIRAFRGAERRLQVLQTEPVTVIDDYAHHPTEVRASLGALRERYANLRLIVAFQPHLYSRTAEFIPEFAEALSLADVVFITDIYPAREDPIPGVSSARIAELIDKEVHYVPSRHLLPREVARIARKGDVVVGMGAGNISEFAPAFIAELNRRKVTNDGNGNDERRTTNDDQRIGGQSKIQNPKSKIAVVFAGDSAEREVSILSGRAILGALKAKGYDAFLLDVSDVLLGKGDLKDLIGSERPDLAFLAVHGTNGEDGAIQGLFELLHIPYTGSGIQASALAMDKRLTKAILERHGLPTPKGQFVTSPDEEIHVDPPLIVKPNAQGSTVGLSFVHEENQIRKAIERALQYDRAALVEEWIQGMEISVPVLGDRALSPVEICPAEGHYDFAAKYTPGATEEICPARLSPEVLERAKDFALKAHHALGCQGATRTDMIVRDNREPVVLEVNTLPGMTGTSLLPNAAKTDGIPFEDLVDWIAQDALRRYAASS